ncbi:rab-GTPase-TBC domain-containing protein [Staphylotrichum tortipilum]|uniref:Rab-GTPase-TBC domain-containing protein n=1 Tax=Staphylotrichum tortipilum TaxID=2831512 RepID=A0AAN6MUP8_9PEZI|nr:rab-GTPase-TBC domain-containing protein [Staphylotrichum longicolle]
MEADRDGGDTTQHQPALVADPATQLLRRDGAEPLTNSPPIAPAAAASSSKTSDHDSLVTVRLSEPPSLHLNTALPPSTISTRKSPLPPHIRSDSTAETLQEEAEEEEGNNNDDDDDDDSESDIFEPEPSAAKRRPNLFQELGQASTAPGADAAKPGRKRRGTSSSTDSERVDWDKLQKKEELESKSNPTASLLARLEQENDRIATNGRRGSKPTAAEKRRSPESRPRPPSMAQLRKMVSGPTPPALRYSTLPPPPMTELEFYLALVKDPKQTAARLPTLLSNKVRKGVPPPLRGVVWQSMAGARDSELEEVFERLTGESSPYEGVINKDLGRSFPGVDMFRDPEGDGQRMLGRVLKCFSLYDTKIGYCQGLGFLVGPLLMHMQDKQAFCILVRLMENYDLRQCFVPDLSGLHVRIYQFRELLRQHLPTLSAHLDDLQVEPAYVSQWFLSFFAVTCPLPMLFRIYDVIFAEGASETVMRVALSLMRKNQARILACTELEDVMHLLLSRGLWDCYNYNADELVQDFVALSGVVTKERLTALEQGYREAKISPGANPRGTGPGGPEAAAAAAQVQAQASADVTTAASRFLGRIWPSSSLSLSSSPSTTTTPKSATFAAAAAAAATSASSSTSAAAAAASASASTPNSTLNPGPGAAVSRPLSMLRRSTSKQSLSSMEAVSSTTSSAASVLSSSTDATTVSRDSSGDDPPAASEGPAPLKSPPPTATAFSGSANASNDGSKYLHSQIEDLLMALSELQRNHALLASQLQKEKEDREEDRHAVRSLLDGLRQKASGDDNDDEQAISPTTTPQPTAEQLTTLLDDVESRFSAASPTRPPSSSGPETKLQLRAELAHAREQLTQERARAKEFTRRLQEVEQEASSVRDQLRESHAHARNAHQEKHRLERQIHGMRMRASDTAPPPPPDRTGTEWFPRAATTPSIASTTTTGTVGLRELKLGRSRSTPSQTPSMYSTKRASSVAPSMLKNGSSESLAMALSTTNNTGNPPAPTSEHDALLLELVQAKTAEAVARQELEEMRQKMEQLRKAVGLAPGETPPAAGSNNNNGGGGGGGAAAAAMGMFGRLTGTAAVPEVVVGNGKAGGGAQAPAAGVGGGFWGWRR